MNLVIEKKNLRPQVCRDLYYFECLNFWSFFCLIIFIKSFSCSINCRYIEFYLKHQKQF